MDGSGRDAATTAGPRGTTLGYDATSAEAEAIAQEIRPVEPIRVLQ